MISLERGTNISHWLSQSPRRGSEREAWFSRDDVQRIAALGFDHIRLPIDEVQMWGDDGSQDDAAFALLDAALDWCAEAGMRAIVDLHILRSHYFNASNVPALFTDPREGARFVELWETLSAHLRQRPVGQVAYELMNEPVAPDAAGWNRVAGPAFARLRSLEPERTLILGSNHFNSVTTFQDLAVPEGDAHCILTFHYYQPMLVTHYTARWVRTAAYAGPINYPGLPAPEEAVRILPEPLRSDVQKWNTPCDASQMAADLSAPLAVRARTGCPLYCGEFGCYGATPQAVRLAWYRDIIAAFRSEGIGWANWDYKGSFGLIDASGADTGIAATLLA